VASDSTRPLVVTGATGYIGRVLVAAAAAQGHAVIAASRRPAPAGVQWLRYDLADELRAEDFPADGTIVHLAANTGSAGPDDEELELRAARRLIAVAGARSLRIVFVSSQTAQRDAPTAYGRLKWRIEQAVLDAGGSVVRPGLVYGGAPGGVFGRLVAVAQRSPVLPWLFPAPQVQPIHVADLAAGLLRVASRRDLPARAFNLAMQPLSFTVFLAALTSVRLRRRRLWLPVPAGLIDAIGATTLGARLLPDAQRIRSLLALPLIESAADLRLLDLELRPLPAGMSRRGDDRRRRLLAEGVALLGYVLGERPACATLLRYVRAIELLRDGVAVGLPHWTARWPAAIALFERGRGERELEWRLDAAVVLAEASTAGARRFMPAQSATLPGAALRILAAVASEGAWRALRAICGPALRRRLATGSAE